MANDHMAAGHILGMEPGLPRPGGAGESVVLGGILAHQDVDALRGLVAVGLALGQGPLLAAVGHPLHVAGAHQLLADLLQLALSHALAHVQQAAFQVGSIITTTGYATTDFNMWPEISRTILVMLMFIGACAGSTGGGFKVSRILILCKTVRKELHIFLHPNAVKKIKMDGKAIPHEVVRSTNIFFIVYVLIFASSVFLIAFDDFDLITNFTAVVATFNNIGPGLELAGPTGNFGMFSWFSKLVLTFDMLAGRLEIFPLLLLFVRDTWRKF